MARWPHGSSVPLYFLIFGILNPGGRTQRGNLDVSNPIGALVVTPASVSASEIILLMSCPGTTCCPWLRCPCVWWNGGGKGLYGGEKGRD